MPESQNLGQANKNNTNVWTVNSNAYKIIVWSRCFSNVSASSDLLQSHKCVIYTHTLYQMGTDAELQYLILFWTVWGAYDIKVKCSTTALTYWIYIQLKF